MPIIALDLETTGLSSLEDSIIEVALIKFEGDVILEEYSTLIDPGFLLPQEIAHLTGITDSDLMGMPMIAEVRDRIANFIGDLPILGHNVEFDIQFLRAAGITLEKNTAYDTFKLAQITLWQERSMNLGHLCEMIGKPFTGQHRALGDTKGTIDLFLAIQKKIQLFSLEEHQIFSYLLTLPGSNPFLDFAREVLLYTPELVDREGIKRLILERHPEYKKTERIKLENFSVTVDDLLGSKKHDGLEDRPEQLRMAHVIDEAYEKQELYLIEAPTGIGKTFAYLTPSILLSLRTGKQVFISTNTKTLQDQIVYKDVPALRDMLTRADARATFSVTKVKGRRNYLGLLPFIDFLETEQFEEYEILCIGKILYWLLVTETGELDELNFYNKEFTLLKTLSADDRRVLENWNPYREREFLYRARTSAKDANIVVINHALLTQDTDETSVKILPEVEYLVVDEAHNLENVSTESFKHSTSLQMIETIFLAIEHSMKYYAKKHPEEPFVLNEFSEYRESIFLYFGMLLDILREYIVRLEGSGENQQRTMTSVLLEDSFYSQDYVSGYEKILQALLSKTHTLVSLLYNAPEELYRKIEKFILELDEHSNVMGKMFSSSSEGLIKIISRNDRGEIFAQFTFLSIGTILDSRLWQKTKSTILTSATLQVNNSFDYIKKTLGATKFQALELESDFDYTKQALIYLPSDIGDIRNNETRKQANTFILDMTKIIGGRTLCLFTSFVAMRETSFQIGSSLKEIGISLLAQGIGGSKQKLLESFKKNAATSVLLGTDSFWEGVDIPGSDVEVLVIHKLPFAVPTDPVFVARSRLFSDSFLEYSVPAMILKLKQGIGRLIRTKQDKGIIVILDSRLGSRWGEIVKGSFPKGLPIRSGFSSEFLKMLEKKYGK